MPFNPTLVSNVVTSTLVTGVQISWDSTAPAGSAYQVYADHHLVWSGTDRACLIPAGGQIFDVGAVAPSEVGIDYSSTLAALPANRAKLTWLGGTYLDPTIDAFEVFGSSVAGGPVDYSKPLARIAAYPDGVITDGFGCGGFGSGGFGAAASSYSWTSKVLGPGAWSFAVDTKDQSGVRSTYALASVTIAGPPNPPALNAQGKRLTYTYDPGTRVATLNWLPSEA